MSKFRKLILLFGCGIICIVALLLLLVGYKRQKDKEEEE
jgi:hypothetical protein